MNIKSVFFLLFIPIIGVIFFYNNLYSKDKIIDLSGFTTIKADNPFLREKGLSSRDVLEENSIMLFEFEYPDKYGFWMRDMKFDIDIIWLDSSHKIIHIEEDVYPSTYPKIFIPKQDSLYVIEANSGFVKENNLREGDFIKI